MMTKKMIVKRAMAAVPRISSLYSQKDVADSQKTSYTLLDYKNRKTPVPAIIGWSEGDITQNSHYLKTFEENKAFRAFLETVLAEYGPKDPVLQSFASYQKTGWIHIPG